MTKQSIHVIGRGIIGLSAAWEFQQRGWDVTLVGPREVAGSASRAAVGVSSVKGHLQGQKPLYQVKLEGHEFLRGWIDRLEKVTGRPLPKDLNGVYEPFYNLTGFDGIISRVYHREFIGAHRVRLMDKKSITNRMVIASSPELKGAFVYSRDLWFDPRAALDRLEGYLRQAGVQTIELPVKRIVSGNGGPGLELRDERRSIVSTSLALLAAGASSTEILRESGINCLQLIGVNGDTVLAPVSDVEDGIIRLGKTNVAVHSGAVWLGSTAYENSVPAPDPTNTLSFPAFLSTDGPGHQLLSGTRARFRDRTPAIGRVRLPSSEQHLWVSLGYYKNGLQLGPLFAQKIANWIEFGSSFRPPSCFTTDRFSPTVQT